MSTAKLSADATHGKLLRELVEETGGAGVEFLARLSEAQARGLLAAIRRARDEEQRALEAAVAEAMSFVPALLRGPLRRILFPG